MPDDATLILDFDGTLITCANRQAMLARACCAARCVRLDPRAFWAAKRQGIPTRTAVADQGVSKSIAADIASDWVDAIETPYWLAYDRIFDDVRTTLASLRATGRRCVLLTARARAHWLHLQLDQLGLTPLLDQVIVVPPSRASAAKAEALAALRPAGFIGDTDSDAAAARAANTPFVALDRGQHSASRLREAGVRTVVHDLDAARAALKA